VFWLVSNEEVYYYYYYYYDYHYYKYQENCVDLKGSPDLASQCIEDARQRAGVRSADASPASRL